jgi:DNA-directed RNA polymerase sigma subunit (sigma70/sigma32)
MNCIKKVKKDGKGCENTECRYFIEHKENQNCTFICIENNGKMTLSQIGGILGTSLANVSMIQRKALGKLQKNLKKDDCLE